jgi:uncharacterized protein YqeY
MKTAMRARDKERLGVLRMVIAELKKKAIDDRAPVDDAGEIAVLQKAVKQRREAAEAFETGGRADSAATELREAEILLAYLPEQLSDDELAAAVKELIEQTGASGPADMGKLMGPLMKRFAGRLDGNRARALVQAALKS